MMKFYPVLLILLNFVSQISAKYNVLSNATIPLKIGEIAFFESPSYPKFEDPHSYLSTNLTFYLNEEIVPHNVKVMVALTYFDTRTIKAYNEIFVLNDLSYSVRSLWSTKNTVGAVQGYVIFEIDEFNACPMESLNKNGESFYFEDESYVIFLQSVYQNLSDPPTNVVEEDAYNFSCNWKFEIPEGYGFKIVLTIFEISSSTEFIVRNTTDIFINSRSANVFHPYYNSDKTTEIFLSSPELRFQFYISLVKNNPVVENGQCTTIQNVEGSTHWTSWRFLEIGYRNNIKCTYNFTVDPNKNYQMSVSGKASLEKDVDILRYQTGNNKTGLITVTNIIDEQAFLFTSEHKEVLFEFITDGSIQDGGFALDFELISCECDNNALECGASTFISKQWQLALCSDMHCNFTIRNCDTSLTQISIEYTDYYAGDQYTGSNYICRVYSDNEIVFDIIYAIKYDIYYEIFVNSSKQNWIEIITPKYYSVIYGEIISHPFEPPLIDNTVRMSMDNSEYDLDLGLTNLTVFKVSNLPTIHDHKFIVYGMLLTNFLSGIWPSFYDDKSLTSNIFTNLNCTVFLLNSWTYKCEFKTSSFTIYHRVHDAPSSFIAVRIPGRGEQTNGCVLEENIFIPKNETTFSVVGIATKNGICKLKVLLSFNSVITSLWTTAKEQNIQIFAGNSEEFLLMEFNSETSSHWTQISLLSNFYIIKIPKGATVFLRITTFPSSVDYIFEIPSNFRSIVSTPQFGALKSNQSGSYLTYSIGNYPIKITTLYYKMAENDYVYFFYYNPRTNLIYINKTGEILEFKNQQIFFATLSHQNMQKDSGAVFLIETV